MQTVSIVCKVRLSGRRLNDKKEGNNSYRSSLTFYIDVLLVNISEGCNDLQCYILCTMPEEYFS